MSPVAARRFVVTGFDHDMWRVIVEAKNAAQALRKVAAIVAADGLGESLPGNASGQIDWQVEPLGERP